MPRGQGRRWSIPMLYLQVKLYEFVLLHGHLRADCLVPIVLIGFVLCPGQWRECPFQEGSHTGLPFVSHELSLIGV